MPTARAARRGRRPRTRPPAILRLGLVIGLLLAFLVGISLLEDGIANLSPSVQEGLFASVRNPIAGLCVGILATVVAQSSSVTTATIVGLVGAGLLDVPAAVPMIMGANIGTTVTNTLASLGHLRRPHEFRLAFAAATVHDLFNVIAVTILLPLELLTGLISDLAEALSGALVGAGGTTFRSPVKDAVDVPAELVADAWHALGAGGTALALLLLATGLGLIFACLSLITRNMRALIADRVERALNDVLGRGAGLPAILVGIVITVAVQSSSITTSILIPLAASGVLALRNTYPVTLGANVGTTITGLLASAATERPEALTIALVHTLFNIGGILLLYPVPALREVPVRLAERVADLAADHRRAVIVYVLALFVGVPLLGVAVLG